MSTIFISHSARDKEFVRRLAKALIEHAHQPWLDEWEIKVGESITSKIEIGLSSAEYVAVVLTTHSVESRWVEREWKAKYWDEVERNEVVVLPLLVEDCQAPMLLKDKKYADFRADFDRGLLELLSAVDPTAQISAAALNIDEDFARGVARLLTRAHSEEPLSSLLVEVMEFARARRLKRLHNFCFGEIQGYHDDKSVPEEVSEVRAYRVIEYFASKAGSINPNYVGFGSPTGLFNYIDANPDKFVPVKVIDRDGVAAIEHRMMSQSPSSTALHLKRPLGSLNPEAADPDRTIHLYAKPDTYSFMAHSIRRELIQLLVTLLPPM